MKLQRQTTFGGADAPKHERGNCWSTCLACILGLDTRDVPNFCAADTEGLPGAWMTPVQEWLRPRGLMCLTFNGDPFEGMPEYRERAVMIASGPGPRGHRHSVLWRNGGLLHDPHPSDAGILEALEFEVLTVLDLDAVLAARPTP